LLVSAGLAQALDIYPAVKVQEKERKEKEKE
jgi:hypothetical protein